MQQFLQTRLPHGAVRSFVEGLFRGDSRGKFNVDRLAAVVPPPRIHRHRYFRVCANGRSLEIFAATPNGRNWPLAADASGISYGGCRFRAASCRNAHGPDCAIKTVLTDPSDVELNALIAATNAVPAVTYGLPVWIEGASDWELNRRVGREYELLPPEAALDPSEDADSIDAAIAMRATFAQESPAVPALFDALARLLTGCERKQ